MDREAFSKMVGKDEDAISLGNWRVIEMVYTYHPCLSEDGLQRLTQVAHLYTEYGFQILLDMMHTAEQVKCWQAKVDENMYVARSFQRYIDNLKAECAKR